MTTATPAPTPTPARPAPPPPRRHPVRTTLLALVLLLVLAGGALFGAWQPLGRAREAYRGGHVAESISIAQKWSRLRLWPGQYHQFLAAALLTGGRGDQARPHLDAVRGKQLLLSSIGKEEVAQRLFARGRYEEFIAYDSAVNAWRDSAPLYRAAAETALDRTAEAEATLRSIDRAGTDAQKLAAVEAAIAQRKSGAYPLFLDRNGRTIAAMQVANKDLVAVDTQFAPLIEKEAGAMTLEAQLPQIGTTTTVVTTLDPAIQRAALSALSGFRGALVAIDPRNGQILAVASTNGSQPMANLAFERQYEPGSVVKVLTGLNALANGINPQSLFPYNCNGVLPIDGRAFQDWLPAGHGPLPSMEEALAQSCNIVFADLGLRLGAERLRALMSRAGFDGETDTGLFRVPLGRFVPPALNRYETANLAIGLERETTTALHLAMLASMMANRGSLSAPRLLLARRSILGEPIDERTVHTSQQIVPREVAEAMIRAMAAVVTSPQGTGRRAAIDGLTIAMKTGTAGSHAEGGLESVIMAFAPVEKPEIAFGMIAEDAGPAEYAGAKIARDFLVEVRSSASPNLSPKP